MHLLVQKFFRKNISHTSDCIASSLASTEPNWHCCPAQWALPRKQGQELMAGQSPAHLMASALLPISPVTQVSHATWGRLEPALPGAPLPTSCVQVAEHCPTGTARQPNSPSSVRSTPWWGQRHRSHCERKEGVFATVNVLLEWSRDEVKKKSHAKALQRTCLCCLGQCHCGHGLFQTSPTSGCAMQVKAACSR